jgi:hypothetical protein
MENVRTFGWCITAAGMMSGLAVRDIADGNLGFLVVDLILLAVNAGFAFMAYYVIRNELAPNL